MNNYKDITFSNEARNKIGVGVSKLARAVSATLGPKGRNVLIQERGKMPHSTKDGVTCAKAISLRDPLENLGAQMVQQVASKTADIAGDGTSTATVLAEAIFSQGMKLIASGADPMSLKRGIDKATIEIVKSIKEQSRVVTTSDEIRMVGTISANGDESIGNMIAEAMDKVGNEGIITLEEGKGFETKLRVSDGFEFDRGFLSAYFATPSEVEAGKFRCVLEGARILLIDGKLHSNQQLQDLLPFLNEISNGGVKLVIIAETVENEILHTLAINCAKGALQVVCIKSPGYGSTRSEMLEDLSVLTGAQIRNNAMYEENRNVRDIKMEELGMVRRIEVYNDHTIIVGPEGREEAIKAQCDKIRSKLANQDSQWDLDIQNKRLAKLVGGIATIECGAPTESAMKEKKDRIEDALAATKAAVAEGIVGGGGVCLVRALKSLKKFTTGNTEEDLGVGIVRSAIVEPLRHIVSNAGESPDVVIAKVLGGKDNFGFDAAKLEYCDMFERGVIDPAKVTRVALENAASVAGLLLTTECAIVFEPEEQKPILQQQGR